MDELPDEDAKNEMLQEYFGDLPLEKGHLLQHLEDAVRAVPYNEFDGQTLALLKGVVTNQFLKDIVFKMADRPYPLTFDDWALRRDSASYDLMVAPLASESQYSIISIQFFLGLLSGILIRLQNMPEQDIDDY